ncbi:type II secretion system protein [Spirulina subsalsa FACHB-351]|uniref:Type II secretion system protein n=1 Tax=Spirulina subsalsa FACHB-351 TaxID=234711 RepID=A0ABT3LA69_9CYAN|nr:type II secretion system protein [Spirulina subsalsa]MCW6037870.1 type II secretion system protein [Spirulina subsalsa FACHB-351]
MNPKIHKLLRLGLSRPNSSSSTQGFTLLELLVVVIMVGILAAIVGPGWLGFVNRQRLGTVNSAILRAIQETQSKAQAEKVSYSIAFRMLNGVPQIAIYPSPPQGTANFEIPGNYWRERDLGKELGINRNQVLILTNLAGDNTLANPDNVATVIPNVTTNPNPNQVYPSITFTHTGDLPDPFPVIPAHGFQMVVAFPQSPGSDQPVNRSKQCVVLQTLIGGLRTGEGEFNATTNPQGCI